MKKIFFLLILITGINKAEHAYAQYNTNPVFDIPDERFTRRFTVELDRGNKMQVSVTSISDLSYISNVDSIVKLFSSELALIKDSLLPTGLSRRIDYNMDVASIKKVRVRKTAAQGNYYAFINGSPVLLKMQQDTIVIFGKLPHERLTRPGKANHYFSVMFCLNDLNDLAGYKDGRLNEKIRIIQQNYKGPWLYGEDDLLQSKKYPEIITNATNGRILPMQHIGFRKFVEIQNYKNHFIPSISCMLFYIMDKDFVKREIGIRAEEAFSFEKNDAGIIKARINFFAGLEYHAAPSIKEHRSKIYPYVSILYLVDRKGNVYDKATFRVGFVDFSLGTSYTRIQPAIYFNNFLQHITPSLRIMQRF